MALCYVDTLEIHTAPPKQKQQHYEKTLQSIRHQYSYCYYSY